MKPMRCSFLLLFVIVLNINTLLSQSPPFFEWQYSIWMKHNELRSKVAIGGIDNQPFSTNMEQILYDSDLEQIPLSHALKCNYTNNDNLNREAKQISNDLSFTFNSLDQFGENIAFDLRGPVLSFDGLQDIIERQWFNNYKYYDYWNNECIASTNIDCSAYEKLLWAKTRYMACGVSICPSLYFPDNTIKHNAAFIVCNYWPSFDKDELPIYNTTESITTTLTTDDIEDNLCTNCAMDRSNECINGLCGGCPAPNYNYCQDRILICDSLTTSCNTDPIAQLYCPFTCFCTLNDWIPATQCDDLYLYGPTSSPTATPTNNKCWRLGWYDAIQIENDTNIQCPKGYSLPIIDSIKFVQKNCLMDGDLTMLQHELPITRIKPYGIAIDWIQYNIGCDWNRNYKNGVIPTHTGIKCGDRQQLFICIPNDINTRYPTTDHPTNTPIISTMNPTETPTTTKNPTISPTTSKPITSKPITSEPSTSKPTTISPTDNPSINPSTSKPTELPTYRPSMTPTQRPTDEPTEPDDTESPTSSPTEGPTFSPTIEPTNEPTDKPTISPITQEPTSNKPTDNPTISPSPSFETTFTIDIPATTTYDFDPFRMYLIFPDRLNTDNAVNSVNANGNAVESRRMLLSDYNQVSDDNDDNVELYPLHGMSISLPIRNNIGYGYQFNLSRKMTNNIKVGLSQIIYAIDTTLCDLKEKNINSLMKFKLFKQSENEWMEIECIEYNVKYKDENIVIDVVDGGYLQFDVSYMFVIDISLLRDICMDLSHDVYGKSFGNFNVKKKNFMVNGVNGITFSSNNKKINQYKYWMKMSMKFI